MSHLVLIHIHSNSTLIILSLIHIYFEEKTQAVLAKELSISQVQISRLEKKALAIIKEKMTS